MKLQPLDPATERMFAQQARVTAQCAGNADSTEADFYLNTLHTQAVRGTGDEFADMLRARTAKKD